MMMILGVMLIELMTCRFDLCSNLSVPVFGVRVESVARGGRGYRSYGFEHLPWSPGTTDFDSKSTLHRGRIALGGEGSRNRV